MSRIGITRLRREQLRTSAGVLARAFDDDPIFRYLYPGRRRRKMSARGFLAALVRDAMPFGEVWAALDDGVVVGAAGWLPEGAYPPSGWRQFRQIVGASAALLTPDTLREGLRYVDNIPKLHPKEPHWYLAVIGVEPSRQGEGVGGNLLDAVLDRLDATGVPAYLETSTEANVAWYRHHGFEVEEEARPSRSGPPVWTMWREPVSA